MTDKAPATKKATKPQKITIPRLFNALEDVVDGAGLTVDSKIGDLYVALDEAIVKAARGQ